MHALCDSQRSGFTVSSHRCFATDVCPGPQHDIQALISVETAQMTDEDMSSGLEIVLEVVGYLKRRCILTTHLSHTHSRTHSNMHREKARRTKVHEVTHPRTRI